MSRRDQTAGSRLATDSELLGIQEAAELVGVAASNIRARLSRGQIVTPIARLASGPVWTKPQLEQWAAERQPRARAPAAERRTQAERRGPDAASDRLAVERAERESDGPHSDAAARPRGAHSRRMTRGGGTSFDAQRLLMARLHAGMSQRELGQAAHVGETTIRNWESGRVAPSPKPLRRIAGALDKTPGWFFDDDATDATTAGAMSPVPLPTPRHEDRLELPPVIVATLHAPGCTTFTTRRPNECDSPECRCTAG